MKKEEKSRAVKVSEETYQKMLEIREMTMLSLKNILKLAVDKFKENPKI